MNQNITEEETKGQVGRCLCETCHSYATAFNPEAPEFKPQKAIISEERKTQRTLESAVAQPGQSLKRVESMDFTCLFGSSTDKLPSSIDEKLSNNQETSSFDTFLIQDLLGTSEDQPLATAHQTPSAASEGTLEKHETQKAGMMMKPQRQLTPSEQDEAANLILKNANPLTKHASKKFLDHLNQKILRLQIK